MTLNIYESLIHWLLWLLKHFLHFIIFMIIKTIIKVIASKNGGIFVFFSSVTLKKKNPTRSSRFAWTVFSQSEVYDHMVIFCADVDDHMMIIWSYGLQICSDHIWTFLVFRNEAYDQLSLNFRVHAVWQMNTFFNSVTEKRIWRGWKKTNNMEISWNLTSNIEGQCLLELRENLVPSLTNLWASKLAVS